MSDIVFDIACPHCQTIFEAEAQLDDTIKCPQCHRPFILKKSHILGQKKADLRLRDRILLNTLQVIGGVIGVLAVVFMAVFLQVHGCSDSSSSSSSSTASSDSEVDAFFNDWDGSNRELVQAVKAGMHDPSSFEHVETRYRDNGTSYTIIMTFRGKNALGATVTQQVTANIDKQTRQISGLKPL